MSIFLIGCSSEPPEPVRLGLNAWPGYEFLYLAQEKGFYKSEGGDVRLIEFNSLSDARRAYERGQIDGIGTTIIEVLQIREYSKRSPQIVHAVDYSDGADMILGQPSLTNSANLRGAKIGVELASVCVFVLHRALEKQGLTLNDVTLVSSDQATMSKAFNQGELNAVVTYPPTTVSLLRDGRAVALFTSAEIPGEILDVIAFEEELCKRRPEDVKKILRAFDRAIEYARTNPDDAFAIMAKREGITAAEFKQTLTDGVRIISPSEQADYLRQGGKISVALASGEKALRATGQIKGESRTNSVINTTFAAAGDSRQ